MAFIDLPIELQKRIGSELPDIASVHSLSQVHSVLYHALQNDELVYRDQFLQLYDPPKVLPLSWKAAYILRHRALRSEGVQEFGPVALEMLRDAIGPKPLNLPFLLKRQDLMRGLSKSQQFLEAQLLLAPIIKGDEPVEGSVSGLGLLDGNRFHKSPTMTTNEILWLTMIARRTVEYIKDQGKNFRPPIIWNDEVMPWLWKGPHTLEDVSEMPTKWLSYYVYDRTTLSGDRTLARVDLCPRGNTFTGKGIDIGAFEMHNGKVSEPLDFGGIRGWRRVSWAKQYNGFSWSYQGVLFPGSRVIVGTWGSTVSTGGGFMLWAA